MSDALRSVYIVDDDPSVRRGLTRLLTAAGFPARSFASGDEFLTASLDEGNACILLDVMMPHMSGPELQDELRRRGVHWPIIFLSAHIDVPTTVRAVQRGAMDFLTKPVDREKLVQAVEKALAEDRQRRGAREERQTVTKRVAELSPREHEVMTYVIAGWLNKQIAYELGIALDTVKIHRRRVMEKMEVDSVAQLVRSADLVGVEPRASES